LNLSGNREKIANELDAVVEPATISCRTFALSSTLPGMLAARNGLLPAPAPIEIPEHVIGKALGRDLSLRGPGPTVFWRETMRNPPSRIVGLLPETQYDLDVREAPRFGCPVLARLRVIVRPSFVPVTMTVKDISAKGIGFLYDLHIEPGARLAIFWRFGGAQRWRTLCARVVRLAPRPDGGWLVGCMFQERLQDADLEVLLRSPLDDEPLSTDAADDF
jgi:hypothetical protein